MGSGSGSAGYPDNLVELGRIFGVPVDTILRPDSRLPESESAEPENAASPGVPLKRPVLTGKIRWFAIAAVLLALAGALCNLVSLIWIGRLQERVEALQAQVNAIPERTDTVYIPQSGAQEESALADFDVSYDLQYDPNAQTAEMLHVSIYTRPKELHPENETAKFYHAKRFIKLDLQCAVGPGQRLFRRYGNPHAGCVFGLSGANR